MMIKKLCGYRPSLLLALLNVCVSPFQVAEVQPSAGFERTECKLQDHTDVTVEYVGMKVNGRKIFGGVVPYGKPWGMGDQRSPLFITAANLLVGGKEVPAGQYALMTIPYPDQWTLIFKKVKAETKLVETDGEVKIDLMVKRLPLSRESFIISFDQFRGGCVLNLRWEGSEASVLLAKK